MILSAILAVSLLNVLTAIYCLRRYASRETVMQLCFVVVWTMHYVVGNFLVIISRSETYVYSRFEYFESTYLVSLLVGQYFIWMYLQLLDNFSRKITSVTPLRADAFPAVMFAVAITAMFSLLLVYFIGPGAYFSEEMAQYRARLGDYTFAGVGAFYYLASFLLPATILLGAYALSHRSGRNIALFGAVLIFALLMFVPLGGRGRIVNIVLVLVLTAIIMRGEFRITRILKPQVALALILLFGAAFAWGVIRERMDTEIIATFDNSSAYVLSIDTTRLQFQAFIMERYPASGTFFGLHYLESALGPFYSMTRLPEAGLIPDLSSQYYGETVGAPDLKSAISPSYIGEIYLNFGVIGIIISPFLFFLIVRGAMALGNENNALSLAVIIYFVQFTFFHGGLYALFDLSLIVVPLLLFTRIYSNRLVGRPRAMPVGDGPREPATRTARP